ncbi:MAG: hypothetical protein FJ086_10870 [Deltaproteobacteria bacterium]|nr:hypothetical protein [Deltaproteobacteria bacterium]
MTAPLTTGCILPQDDTLLLDLPPALNRPPRFLEDNMVPGTGITPLSNGQGCEQQFVAYAEDPDAADTLYVSFFIDYDKNPDVSYGSTVITGSGSAVRGSAALTLRADQVGIPLFTVGDHAVDVVVSDEPLQTGRRPRPRPVGTLVDGGPVNSSFAVMHTWFIKTVPGDCL